MPGLACSGPLTGAYTGHDPAGDSRALAVGCRSRPSHFLQVADYPLVAPAAPDGAPRADSHAGRQCPDGGSRCLTGRQSRRSSASRRRLASRRGRSPRQLSVPGSHSRAVRCTGCQCARCRRSRRPDAATCARCYYFSGCPGRLEQTQHVLGAAPLGGIEHSESRRRLPLRPCRSPSQSPAGLRRAHSSNRRSAVAITAERRLCQR